MTAVDRKGRSAPPCRGINDTLAGDVRSATRIHSLLAIGGEADVAHIFIEQLRQPPVGEIQKAPAADLSSRRRRTRRRGRRGSATSFPSRDIVASTSEPGKSVTRSMCIFAQRVRHSLGDAARRAATTAAATPITPAATRRSTTIEIAAARGASRPRPPLTRALASALRRSATGRPAASRDSASPAPSTAAAPPEPA